MRDARATSFTSPGVLLAWALGSALACGGGTEGAAKTAAMTTTYRCGLQVSKRASGEVVGKGSDADAARAEEAAWADACGKLPEAERATCRDETKWQVSKSSMSAAAGGPVTHATTIQLVAIAPSFAGEASSEVSSEEACEAALADACAEAGAPGDCLAAGYEKRGEAIRKTTRLATP